jgi:hypothetical protein
LGRKSFISITARSIARRLKNHFAGKTQALARRFGRFLSESPASA